MKNRKRKFALPPLFLPPEGGLAGNIRVDPQGSYTGVVPEQPEEEPVQDADDLWVMRQPIRLPRLHFPLYFRRVASPPRMCRICLLRSRT